jgi:hypothetical protein
MTKTAGMSRQWKHALREPEGRLAKIKADSILNKREIGNIVPKLRICSVAQVIVQVMMEIRLSVGGQSLVIFSIKEADAVLEFEFFRWGCTKFVLMRIIAVFLPEVAHLCPIVLTSPARKLLGSMRVVEVTIGRRLRIQASRYFLY